MSQPSTANGGFPSVVVTAVTATTSISPDIESTWKGLLAGESGIHALEDEFVTKWDLAVKIGGHLKDPVGSHMGRLDMRRMSYVQRMGKLLGGQLWESAGSPEVDPDRFAVVVGTGLGGAERIVESYDLMNAGGPRKVSPLAVQMIMPNGAAAVIGLQLSPRRGDDPGVGLFVGLGSDRPRVASDRDGRRRRRRLRRCRRTHRGAAHRGVLHDAGHVDPQRRA